MDAYWRAANYLSVGQIYLHDNPLLRSPLTLAHVKPLVVGHWGTTPGELELSLASKVLRLSTETRRGVESASLIGLYPTPASRCNRRRCFHTRMGA